MTVNITCGVSGLCVAAFFCTSGGCGNVSRDAPDARDTDASAPQRCDLSKPFASIQPVPGLNTPDDEEGPTLSPDELTVYFASNRNAPGSANFDLYVASRSSRDSAFGNATALAAISSAADDRGVSLSADGLSLFFHSSRSAGNYDIFVSTRLNTSANFGAATALSPDINTAALEGGPFVSADGAALYFTRAGAIERASLGATGFTNPQPLNEFTMNGADATTPALSEDGLVAYFGSTRMGGAGMMDIWTASRTSTTGTFGQFANLGELNTAEQDFATWLSPDGCRLYFWSSRSGGAGGFDAWQATRPQ